MKIRTEKKTSKEKNTENTKEIYCSENKGTAIVRVQISHILYTVYQIITYCYCGYNIYVHENYRVVFGEMGTIQV